MENKKSILIIVVPTIVAIIVIPIGVNVLMGSQFEGMTVYGNTPTWIAFFGSYLGSILSGVITFLGVLLTILYTQKQSSLSLSHVEEQHRENIRFAREESRREKIPEIINNIEECIDFVEQALEELEFLSRGDFEEILYVSRADRTLKVFYINDAYHLAKTERLIDITKNYLRTIRNYTVKADTPAYEVFLRFSSNLKSSYVHISDLESEFIGFQKGMMNDYIEIDSYNLFSNEGNIKEVELNDLDQKRLLDMKIKLYEADTEYLKAITEDYKVLHKELNLQLDDLVGEFSR